VNPGNDTVTFKVRGTVVARNADGIAQYSSITQDVTGCFLQDAAMSDKVGDTEFAESTHHCISPTNAAKPLEMAAVVAVNPEDTLVFNGVDFRVIGKKVYRDWNGKLDHITVYCQEQNG
jgi:hypothetical protein